MIIERILTLIRNVLQVPPNDNEIRTENDATVHDEVEIWENWKLEHFYH